MSKGRGYNGGQGISTANQEILTIIDATWTKPRGEYYELSFLNTQACTIKINGSSSAIPCPANVGFEMDENDAEIKSFVVVESGIDYKWRGKY